MFIECRDFFMNLLSQSGCKTKPFKSRKQLKLSGESHIGAVLFSREYLEKDNQKRIYYDDFHNKIKRKKTYQREIVFSIVIGEYDIERVQEIYEIFLEKLPDGIMVHENYVEFLVEEADWLDDEDSVIKSKCAVQFSIRCVGGVYKDTEYRKIDAIEIVVSKEEA